MTASKKITFIGAGNVATHLAKALYNKDYVIDTIYSKTKKNATLLANEVDSFGIDSFSQLDNTSDIYIIAVKDDVIEEVLEQFPFKDKLIVHTSGSISIDIFKENNCSNFGIFYPLQTFTKDKSVYLDEVPLCVEGSESDVEKLLINLAKDISDNVYKVDSEQRKKLHLAAVFACNFTNYMYTISEDILTRSGIDFDILKPLIKETANKVINNSPKSMQTGPAQRNDTSVIDNHIQLLRNNKAYQNLYELLSNSIIDQ